MSTMCQQVFKCGPVLVYEIYLFQTFTGQIEVIAGDTAVENCNADPTASR